MRPRTEACIQKNRKQSKRPSGDAHGLQTERQILEQLMLVGSANDAVRERLNRAFIGWLSLDAGTPVYTNRSKASQATATPSSWRTLSPTTFARRA